MNKLLTERNQDQSLHTDFLSLSVFGDKDHLKLSYGEFLQMDDLFEESLNAIAEAVETLNLIAAVIGSLKSGDQMSGHDLDVLCQSVIARGKKAQEIHDRLDELSKALASRSELSSRADLEELLKQLGEEE